MFDAELVRRNVPPCLTNLPQWVCWKYVQRDGQDTKCPFDPKTGECASSTDPATWGTFAEALKAARRYVGIGFVFTSGDEFCGIDLDDCVALPTGEFKPWGQRIIDTANSYSEFSPSGLGVKIFMRARKPGSACRKPLDDGEVEMYDHARFFTVTGLRIEEVSRDVEARQGELNQLYAEVFGGTPSPSAAEDMLPDQAPAITLPDEEILRLATSPRRSDGRGEKFESLWAGRWNDYFNSPSEADSSVVFTLAYYTKDAAQIDRLFRRSKLFREKWDEARGAKTYGQVTIAKALETVTGQYRPRKRRNATPQAAAASTTLSPDDPFPPLYQADEVARLFREANARIIYWRGVFHLYGSTCYRPLMEAELGARIAKFVADVGVWARPAEKYKDGWEIGAVQHPAHEGVMVIIEKIVPTTHHVREIVLQLKKDFLPDVVEAPCWTGDTPGPNAAELVACRNGLLHLPANAMHPHSDNLFALNAVDYDYQPSARAPGAWLGFLGDLFAEDIECVEALQELFGYFLLPDTRQQKIGLIVGPRRSGKGTIARVLTGVLGPENVCGPTLGSLATNFGLWPLLHKRLAIISDARLSGRTDQAVVVERLLSISGEDSITVDRKHLSPWTGKLPTRFLILTNELPRFTDASGALAGRFILLCLTKSWYGREDHELTDRLLEELPGILNWSIAGWRRLYERGYFVQPRSSQEAIEQLEDLGSPIGAFVRDRCEVGQGLSVEINTLFAAWQSWCVDSGRTSAGTIQSFGRDLRAAYPGLRATQPRTDGARTRHYEGLALCAENGGEGNLARDGTRALTLHV